jgi:hypothetical protein
VLAAADKLSGDSSPAESEVPSSVAPSSGVTA